MGIDPVILFFSLGIIAHWLKSDLQVPKPIYDALSVYLLIALGLKGGVELAKHPFTELLPQTALVVGLGCVLPVVAFFGLRLVYRLDRLNAGAIAAHYGSVSVVTFAAGVAYLETRQIDFEPYMALFMAVLEVPGLIVGVLLARGLSGNTKHLGGMVREVLTGKSILLLIGGIVIGALLGPAGVKPIAPFFTDSFRGALCIFMLELGLVAALKASELKKSDLSLIAFAVLAPLVLGLFGAALGHAMDLSVGGTMLLTLLAGSASYIAAPAAMRVALPDANTGLSLPLVLGVTFPFNVIIGLPIYHQFAIWIRA